MPNLSAIPSIHAASITQFTPNRRRAATANILHSENRTQKWTDVGSLEKDADSHAHYLVLTSMKLYCTALYVLYCNRHLPILNPL